MNMCYKLIFIIIKICFLIFFQRNFFTFSKTYRGEIILIRCGGGAEGLNTCQFFFFYCFCKNKFANSLHRLMKNVEIVVLVKNYLNKNVKVRLLKIFETLGLKVIILAFDFILLKKKITKQYTVLVQ